MLARLLIPLCLCCVVLCAFVGFLSKRAITETAQVSSVPVEFDCSSFIDSPPKKSSGVLLKDFVFVDLIATIDKDGDGKWDEVAIPLFSPDGFKSKAYYSAAIACFQDVPDLETLHQRLASNELQAYYWVNDQKLSLNLHSQLATKFKHMDFQQSPVVTVGYGNDNPLLGEASLEYSYLVGAAAVGVLILTLAYLVVAGLLNAVPRSPRRPRRASAKNRAGLPNSETDYNAGSTGGVLDQARSMRNRQPQA